MKLWRTSRTLRKINAQCYRTLKKSGRIVEAPATHWVGWATKSFGFIARIVFGPWLFDAEKP
jgi:hypothetical protein